MNEDVRLQLDRDVTWIKDKTALREVNDWVEITTPMVDRHNDQLQIYVKRENGHYVMTDDGYTLRDLAIAGCKLEASTRQDLLKITLAGSGIHG